MVEKRGASATARSRWRRSRSAGMCSTGRRTKQASFAVLDAFVDAGGNMIDTADVYSAWVTGHKGGESEAVIGRWLKRDPKKRDKVIIATKVGMLDGQIVDGEYETVLHPNVIARACDNSLRRLGIERDRSILSTPRRS